jgi:hypothetical protein
VRISVLDIQCTVWLLNLSSLVVVIVEVFLLYGCNTCSLTLTEERRLRVLRRIFGPKRDEVTGE